MDIVERLRGDHSDERLELAADEIERLREELNQRMKMWKTEMDAATNFYKEIEHLRGRIETLQQVVRDDHTFALELFKKRERYRGLLKDWVDCCFVNFVNDTIEIVDVGKVYVETRAALKGDE